MEKDTIKAVEIDSDGRLHIVTNKAKFPMIYRSAKEVHWDPINHSLYSPKPRQWSYFQWFNHIIEVAENDCFRRLEITNETEWLNIPDDLKQQINSK